MSFGVRKPSLEARNRFPNYGNRLPILFPTVRGEILKVEIDSHIGNRLPSAYIKPGTCSSPHFCVFILSLTPQTLFLLSKPLPLHSLTQIFQIFPKDYTLHTLITLISSFNIYFSLFPTISISWILKLGEVTLTLPIFLSSLFFSFPKVISKLLSFSFSINYGLFP